MFPTGPIALPAPLQHQVEYLVKSFLQMDRRIDFSEPAGEPALLRPDSISWRIFKNPVAVFVGGVTAVLLELAEPRVRDGIWQHSSFPSDPLTRLKRTSIAAMVTVYGPHRYAETMIAGVVRRHDRVTGRTSEGELYEANDPVLLDWVQTTAGFGFMEAYHAYVRPLTTKERDELCTEALPTAHLYGATGAPSSQEDLDVSVKAMGRRLAASPIVFEFLEIMGQVPILPAPARPFQRMLLKAAVEILPGWVRDRLGLGCSWSLTPTERLFMHASARVSDRLILRSSPAVQSCRRLGLADAYLYR